jgi:DNA-binding SARP family transcriptional activator
MRVDAYASLTGRKRHGRRVVEFGILGPLEVRDGDRALALTGAKQRALLVVLLLHANEVVSSDRLLDELWGEEPPGSGATALQVLVSRLRDALGPGEAQLVTRAPGYVLEVERRELDLYRFEDLLEAAVDAEADVASGKLREALALWRGPALIEFSYEGFAQSAIGRLGELRLVALERRIEADLSMGRHAELVGELDALVAEHPLRERFRLQLMLALYRSGRQAEALDAYKAARRALIEELGIEPSPALQELEREVLRQDPALDLAQLEVPSRSLLVVAFDEENLDALVTLAESLAARPSREVVVARMVSADEVGPATQRLHARREKSLAKGVAARAAAFSSDHPGRDVVRLTSELDVDLIILDARPRPLDDEVTKEVLRGAPCDVALLVTRLEASKPGPVLVPFAGAEHDWSAIEIGAWIAGNRSATLWLAGPREPDRDASRLLASASLAVQRAYGVAAEPLLVELGPERLVRAADGASLIVAGLSERWQKDGLGPARSALATEARPSVVFVRRGLRPGGLAPSAALTRFTWTRSAGAVSAS